MEKTCTICGRVFYKRTTENKKYWNTRSGCSYKCSFILRSLKYKPYIRTSEHKKKMSDSHKKNEKVVRHGRELFKRINSAKKGKTLEEIYGKEKALVILSRYRRYGDRNGNWRGGKSFVPYAHHFNKELKLKIKTRDGFVCMNCGIDEGSYRGKEALGRGLTIHHINYNKLDCSENNLITLCKRCNSKANSNRDIWMEKYQKLLGR